MYFITFTRAIILFFVIQTLLYFFLLKISVNDRPPKHVDKCFSPKIINIAYVIVIFGTLLTILTGFRNTYLYRIIILILPIIVLYSIKCNVMSPRLISTLIMWHLMIIIPSISPSLISITEGVHMTRDMIFYGKWIPEYAHNPSYNPFPTMAYIRAILAETTGMSWYNWYIYLIIIFYILIVYDFSMYALTAKLTNNKIIGIITIIFIALTPYIVITSHAYQIPANALWLLNLYIILRIIGHGRQEDFVTSTLLFSAAILTHPTSYIVILFPIILLLIIHIQGIRRFSSNFVVNYNFKKNIFLLLVMYLILGLLRSAFEAGFVNYVGESAIISIKNLIFRVLNLQSSINSLEHMPLYDYGGVPPYQAFLWSLAASIATALLLFKLLKRNINIIELAMFITSTIFISAGYIFGVYVRNLPTSAVYRGTYVAFSLLIPFTGIFAYSIIKKRYYIILIMIIILASSLALNDPEISPIASAKVRGIPVDALKIEAHPSDIQQANTLLHLMKDPLVIKKLLLFSYNSITYIQKTALKGEHIVVKSGLSDALYKILYIHGYTVRDRPIVNINSTDNYNQIYKSSIIFNSGNNLVILY